jgi:hypothetical protein
MVASAQRVKDSSRAESLRSVLRACHGAVWTVDLLVNNAAISAAAMVEGHPGRGGGGDVRHQCGRAAAGDLGIRAGHAGAGRREGGEGVLGGRAGNAPAN